MTFFVTDNIDSIFVSVILYCTQRHINLYHNISRSVENMSQEWQEDHSATSDINILLLGQTDVGKTTFIHAFANYLVYNSLDEAIDGKL